MPGMRSRSSPTLITGPKLPKSIVGKKTKGKSGIKPGKTPVSYEQLIDTTLWTEAMALVKKSK